MGTMVENKKPKVIVCGAGIGGLTVAHELSQRGFDVTVYERNDMTGGLARSAYYKDEAGQTYPVEYSWRIYGSGYRNLLRLLKDIPLSTSSGKSVFDNLVQISTYIFPRFDKTEVVVAKGKNIGELTSGFPKGDRLKILDKTLYCLSMSRQRMDSLDSLKWKDFCDDLSPEAKKYLIQLWAPVLGLDMSYMSFPVIGRMIKIILGAFVGGDSRLYLMNKPTNDAWFDEWVKYLTSQQGVKIFTNHEIQDLVVKSGQISKVVLKDKLQNKIIEDSADYIVCGLSVESIAGLTAKNSQLSAAPTLAKTIPLAKTARQLQLSVQIFLDTKLIYPSQDLPVLYLPDSPWALIIEPEDYVWPSTYSTNPKVKTVLSVGICVPDVVGIAVKKPFKASTKAEMEQEVWAEIVRSYSKSNIKTESGETIDKANIELFYMWDSFKFDEITQEIDVWEPKFSNNANALQYQPDIQTEISNLYFATAYTKTDRFIYSMEAAAEAGGLCANAILRQQGSASPQVKTHSYNHSAFVFAPLMWIDFALYKLGLPHLGKIIGSSVVLVGLYLILLVGLTGFAVSLVF